MSLAVLSVAYPFAPVGRDAVGGAEQVLGILDRALTAAGHRSIVIACAGSDIAGLHYPTPAHSGPIGDLDRHRAWACHRKTIADASRDHAVDLVHLHGIDFAAYAPAQGPTLATLHLPLDWYDADVLRNPRPDLWMHGVSLSQQKSAPAGARLLSPIENGVDVSALSACHAKRDFALFLGRVCPEKGVHLAIEAARRAGIPLLIAGQVFNYESHRRYFAETIEPRFGPRCRFVGALNFERKRRFLTAARCLVVPSLAAETSSLVAMEALACGTPVIALRSGALPEIVKHGQTGFLVDTVDDMAKGIAASIGIEPETCRREARERFSMDAMTEAYFALYRRLTCRTAAFA
jgi:glycosyltransferase involved in cell wall biosynthesis